MTKKTEPAWCDVWIVDTNIWVDYFQTGNSKLTAMMRQGRARSHEVVFAELRLPADDTRLALMRNNTGVPTVGSPTVAEAIALMEQINVGKIKCGIADFLILQSCKSLSMGLWTGDHRAIDAAKKMGVKLMA